MDSLAALASEAPPVNEDVRRCLMEHASATDELLQSQESLVAALVRFAATSVPDRRFDTRVFGSRHSGLCNPDSDVRVSLKSHSHRV